MNIMSKQKKGATQPCKYQVKLLSNAPVTNDITETYANALAAALERSAILNIALTGGYCTGKSSILDTFKQKYGKGRDKKTRKNVLKIKEISFVALKNGDTQDGSPSHMLQREIVSQLYYESKPKIFNWSRFTRINPYTSCATGVLISIVFLLWRFLPFIQFLQKSPSWLMIIIRLALELGVAVFAFIVSVNILSKVRLKQFGFGDISIELADDKPDFEQLLDELITIFSREKYDVVIFEDLDRFNNIQIYEDLRQLNYKLNHAEQIKRPIRFVYAMRDSLILNGSERNKLFDAVLPVVPFISPHNVEEYLQTQLSKVGVKIENPQLSRLIATTLAEARQITAFVNAAAMHVRCICNEPDSLDWISKDEVIAIAFIRQLWPQEYEALQHGTSNIDALFDFAVNKKQDKLKILRQDLERLQETNDVQAMTDKQKSYANEREKTTWAVAERILESYEEQEELEQKLNLPAQEREAFSDIMSRLIATGVLSDSFRACIAPYHGSKVSMKALNFINNSLRGNGVLEYDTELSIPEIQKITEARTKYDFDSLAFLNFSIVDAIINQDIKQITLGDFLESQQRNLVELILFHDAYAHYCMEKKETHGDAPIKRLRQFVYVILQLYPKELIGHALISGLLDPDWPVYKCTNHIFLKVMSENNTELAEVDVPHFIKAINRFYAIEPESIKDIIKTNNILFDEIGRINNQFQDLIDFIVQNNLFIVNAHNLTRISGEISLSGLLMKQQPKAEVLKQILSEPRRIHMSHINEVLDYIFQHQDLCGLGREVASAVTSKMISLPSDRIATLIRYVYDEPLLIETILLAKMTDNELIDILRQLGGQYSKLTEPRKRPSFPNDKSHQKLVQKLEEMGKVVRIASKKPGYITVRVA